MKKSNLVRLLWFSLFLFFFANTPVFAWGPAVHLYLGSRFLQLGLGCAAAQIIRKFPRFFLYGNVVADIVAAKSKVDFEQSSHNWQIIETLNDNISTDRQKAFVSGYRMHLAADTVAHNFFVPEHRERLKLPDSPAHAYLEMRAEDCVPLYLRKTLKDMQDWPTGEIDTILEDSIPETIFPFYWNWKIFSGILRLSSSNKWHRMTKTWNKFSRHDLTRENLEEYWDLSLERMTESINSSCWENKISKLDPTGTQQEKISA